MYNRNLSSELLRLKASFPVLVVTGPCQSGKTTLCKMTFPDYDYVNLEDELVRDEIAVKRREFLMSKGNLIIDEAQNMPEIFSMIQVMVDENPELRYVVTDSNNFSLMQSITQSMAGRAAMLTLLPLSFSELTDDDKSVGMDANMLRGFYPAVLAKKIPAQDAYRQYYNTYLQRDILQVMNVRHLNEFRKFLIISASRVGCEFNASSISNELGMSLPTVAEWMNILEATYVAFRLQPFYRNIGKRLVKTPKVYFYDVGLVCYLLGIKDAHQIETHPLRGQIFENMVVTEFLKNRFNHGLDNNLYFYRDRSGNEVDVVLDEGLQSLQAFEIKLSATLHPSFYKNLKHFKGLFNDEICRTQVVNTSAEDNDAPFTGHLNYRHIETLLKGD